MIALLFCFQKSISILNKLNTHGARDVYLTKLSGIVSGNEQCPLERTLDAAVRTACNFISGMRLMVIFVSLLLCKLPKKNKVKLKLGREASVLVYASTGYASKHQCFAQ